MKIKPYNFMAIWGIIVSPVLSLPFILYGIYKKNKYSLYLMAFFLGIVAFLTPPVSDLYRHTSDYFFYQSLSWENFLEFLDKDVIAQIVSYTFSKIGINYAFVRLLFVSISLIIYFYIFHDLLYNQIIKRKNFFLLWIILLTGYNYFELVLGVRYGLAVSFFFGSFYLLYFKHSFFKSLIFVILSSLTHFFLFPISIIMFSVYYIPFSIKKRYFFILCGVFMLIGFSLASNFILTYYEQQSSYIDGSWGIEYKSSLSFKGLTYYYLKRIWILPLVYFYLKDEYEYLKVRKLIYILLLMFISVIPLATLSGRIITIISIFLLFYFILRYKSKKQNCIFNIILISSTLFFCSNLYTYRFVLGKDHYIDLCKPLFFVLDNDIYSKSWMYNNINEDGYFK